MAEVKQYYNKKAKKCKKYLMNNSVFVRSQENRQKKPPKEELRLLLRAERKNSPDFRGNFVKSLKKNYDSLMLACPEG